MENKIFVEETFVDCLLVSPPKKHHAPQFCGENFCKTLNFLLQKFPALGMYCAH